MEKSRHKRATGVNLLWLGHLLLLLLLMWLRPLLHHLPLILLLLLLLWLGLLRRLLLRLQVLLLLCVAPPVGTAPAASPVTWAACWHTPCLMP